MRIVDIMVKDKPPVKHFETTNLSNIIVLAGPNGIGKTRLIQQIINLFQNPRPDQMLHVKIKATVQNEKDRWEKETLSTLDSSDSDILRIFIKIKEGGNGLVV